MNRFQVTAITAMAVFYLAYFLKAALQRRRGIQTRQMGGSSKAAETRRVEKILGTATLLVPAVELTSILLNTSRYFGDPLRYFGLALAWAGDVLFILAMWTMRDSWRAGIPATDQTELVADGIYRLSRNPAFLGFDLTYIGLYLMFDNVILLAASLFAIMALHLQILEEEKFLEARFGEKYLEYKKKTGRYFILI
ncbi:MAG TPA: isoprenylcysteine carboxylmethyltransferase family protein [Caproiciproducens sp.]|nr:isoprenylcysteine carboxylmethyltransferase family protein [Caproiciproducens sp.]